MEGRLDRRNDYWGDVKRINPLPNNAIFSVEKRFFDLARAWKNQTAGYSLVAKKITNEKYMDIIGMGVTLKEPVIRLILQDLQKGPDFWHFALKSITQENPVAKADIRDLRKVREAWLAWGNQHNLL